jgi:hypothetical protein
LIRGSGGAKSMPKPYSDDLRERVIEAVVAGASRREAAESFSLSASSAVRWLQRWRDSGSTRAKLSGGSTSPLEEQVEWLLALAAECRRVEPVTHQDASESRLYVDAATRRLNAPEHASTWSQYLPFGNDCISPSRSACQVPATIETLPPCT